MTLRYPTYLHPKNNHFNSKCNNTESRYSGRNIELDSNVNTYSRISAKFVADYTNGRRMVQTSVGHKTADVALMPVHFEAVLGKDYTVGDTLTLRSHSPFKAKYGYSNDPKVLPLTLKDLEGNAEVKETIELDAEGNFGHWLMVYNPNELEDVNITVLVAKA